MDGLFESCFPRTSAALFLMMAASPLPPRHQEQLIISLMELELSLNQRRPQLCCLADMSFRRTTRFPKTDRTFSLCADQIFIRFGFCTATAKGWMLRVFASVVSMPATRFRISGRRLLATIGEYGFTATVSELNLWTFSGSPVNPVYSRVFRQHTFAISPSLWLRAIFDLAAARLSPVLVTQVRATEQILPPRLRCRMRGSSRRISQSAR